LLKNKFFFFFLKKKKKKKKGNIEKIRTTGRKLKYERKDNMGCKLYLKEKMNSITKAANINNTLLKTKGTIPDTFLQG
jgi:hypothetical protein